MSIESLEEKYRHLQGKIETAGQQLSRCSLQASAVQHQMRVILGEVAPDFCGPCEHKCCEGFPLEGWFSFEDYLLFRIQYGKPTIPPDRVMRDTACAFLTPDGCSLPADMRPFTCVKVNCEQINDALQCSGEEHRYNALRKALDAIIRDVSMIIAENSVEPLHADHHINDAADVPVINARGA
jgi:hypothetical protein